MDLLVIQLLIKPSSILLKHYVAGVSHEWNGFTFIQVLNNKLNDLHINSIITSVISLFVICVLKSCNRSIAFHAIIYCDTVPAACLLITVLRVSTACS